MPDDHFARLMKQGRGLSADAFVRKEAPRFEGK